jgi:hypothetical protein
LSRSSGRPRHRLKACRKRNPCGRSACIRVPFPAEAVPRVPQHPPDEMPDEGATTGTPHDARLRARASVPAANACTPAMDDARASHRRGLSSEGRSLCRGKR